MKRSVHIREPYDSMDLTQDCMQPYERLKGSLKKIYQRTTRTRLKRESLKEIREANS